MTIGNKENKLYYDSLEELKIDVEWLCKHVHKYISKFFYYYIIYNYNIIMSISSTGLYGSATIVNSDLFNDVEALKEEMVSLSTSYLTTTQEHHDDISQNRQDISSNLSKINDISNNGIKDIEDNITDLSDN
jgi:hypothetical protein